MPWDYPSPAQQLSTGTDVAGFDRWIGPSHGRRDHTPGDLSVPTILSGSLGGVIAGLGAEAATARFGPVARVGAIAGAAVLGFAGGVALDRIVL